MTTNVWPNTALKNSFKIKDLKYFLPVHVGLSKVAPLLSSLLIAATLIVYFLLAVNPVMLAVVPCTSGGLPSSGETVTRYPTMVFASPPRTGAFQLILIDDSVTLLMIVELGLSKTEQNIFRVIPSVVDKVLMR